MRGIGRRWWIVAACCIAASLPASGQPAARPAGAKAAAACDDAWLGRIALEELTAAVETGRYEQLAGQIRSAILGRLACGHLEQLGALTDLVYVLRACEHLAQAESLDRGKDLAEWLVANRPVSRLLSRALGDVKKPKDSLAKLQELLAASEAAVTNYTNLAVAFATSQPRKGGPGQPNAASMVGSFAWYTNPKTAFRYDLKKMPYELSRYLADTRLSLAERRWAMQNYARHPNPASAYFHVKYDYDFYRKDGAEKEISKLEYTLPNLRRVGGVCVDQAYYASEVCKALGMPATVVGGRSGQGGGHAWVACLRIAPGGRSAEWDARTGRYEEHLYFTGYVRAPTGKWILDAELMLGGAAAQLPLERREQADAAVALARMANGAAGADLKGDLEALRGLAAAHDERLADKNGKADTSWIAAEGKLDAAAVENLLAAAVQANLAHKPAWDLIIELREADRLDADHLGRFFNVLITRTAREYPDYSVVMVLRIVPTLADAARREQIYRRAVGVYGRRPDLQGYLLIALGDDYAKQDKPKQALEAYEQAANRCVGIASVVVKAAGKAEDILRQAGEKGVQYAVGLYQRLFARTRPAKARSAFQRQTAHFQLGKRLATLLIDAGKKDAADRVLKKIGAEDDAF